MYTLIHGKAGCGKDTLANKIMALAPWELDIKSVSLATPIKEITSLYLETPVGLVGHGESDRDYYIRDRTLSNKLKARKILTECGVSEIVAIGMVDYYLENFIHASDVATRRASDIFLGTTIGRNMIDQCLWCNIAWSKLKEHHYKVIPDIRWKDELNYFDNGEEPCIKVKLSDRNLRSCMPDHESEDGLPDELFDFVIPSDITLQGLDKFCLETLNKKLFDQNLKY